MYRSGNTCVKHLHFWPLTSLHCWTYRSFVIQLLLPVVKKNYLELLIQVKVFKICLKARVQDMQLLIKSWGSLGFDAKNKTTASSLTGNTLSKSNTIWLPAHLMLINNILKLLWFTSLQRQKYKNNIRMCQGTATVFTPLYIIFLYIFVSFYNFQVVFFLNIF